MNTFRIYFYLHMLSIIVAFTPAVLAVLPGGRQGTLQALERAGRIVYAPALLLTGVFGALLVGESDAFDFDQTWISLAFVVWIAMNGVFHAMVLPGQRRRDNVKVDNGNAIITVLVLVMLYLMVWKPGL